MKTGNKERKPDARFFSVFSSNQYGKLSKEAIKVLLGHLLNKNSPSSQQDLKKRN